tara:strand:+ start:737 stop:1441 length:705 start_codon:yes stop_codon:yes gene_type:complete
MSTNKLTAIVLYTDLIKGAKTKQCKSICSINNKTTVIQEQIASLKKMNRRIEIVILAGKGHKDIDKVLKETKNTNKIKLVCVDEYLHVNQGQVFLNAINKLNIENNVLLILGEILFKNICCKKLSNNTTWLIDKKRDDFNISCRTSENDFAQYFFYDLPNEKQWSEIIFLHQDTIKQIKQSKEVSNKIKQIFMFELLNKLIDNSIKIDTQKIRYRDIIKVRASKNIHKAKAFIR